MGTYRSTLVWDPNALVVRRPDGSACLMHLDGKTFVLDGPSVADLDRILLSPDTLRGADAALLAELLRARLVRPVIGGAGRCATSSARAKEVVLEGLLAVVRRLHRAPHTFAGGLLGAARWSTVVCGWVGTVGVWERQFPMPPAAAVPRMSPEVVTTLVARHAATGLVRYECKERALSGLALARFHGLPAELVVGVRHLPVGAHAWAEIHGVPISDNPEYCWQFQEVLRYRGAARRGRQSA